MLRKIGHYVVERRLVKEGEYFKINEETEKVFGIEDFPGLDKMIVFVLKRVA